jgi:uncharacterized protein YlaI
MKRWPKFKCCCTVCHKLRIVTPLYETTKEEREEMGRTYVCSDCSPAFAERPPTRGPLGYAP